ncbi:MAG: M28 family peptidase, partial [Flavobacteriales bacterium]|nr:M28 family peptidase [Flavobacteriales bacterium]
LKDVEFENTVVFALWDEEEQGKIGSQYYAGVAAANDDTIAGVVNMDAIAWDGDGDGLMRIHTRSVANSLAIKDTALLVDALYGIGNNIAINDPGATYSDHASFWSEGYGAILVIEDFDFDGNPHYHTPTDLLQYLDLGYFHKLARLSLATFMHLARPVDPLAVIPERREPGKLLAYPSLTQGPVQLDLGDPLEQWERLIVIRPTGGVCRALDLGQTRGTIVRLDLSDLAAGPYMLTALTASGKAVSTKVFVVD